MKRALLLCLLLTGCGPMDRPGRREVSIAAAADLQYALEEISSVFSKAHPDIELKPSYGSSGNFHAQLSNHAPFDVFLSADVQYPRDLTGKGLTLAGSEFIYAVGQIALWTTAHSPIDVEKLGIDALKTPGVARVAIANPQHAPYGRAAEAAMKTLGVYSAVKSKLVFGENVAQALQFVQSGSAQVGIVALSLALSPAVRKEGRFWRVPADSYPRIEQAGVIMRWAKDLAAARAVREFLIGGEGRAILEKYGFSPPGA